MSNKIWNFDILVDDCFVNFNTKKQEINPDHNDRLLSVANGFEDGSYGAQNETYIEGWEKKASNLLIYKRLCKI